MSASAARPLAIELGFDSASTARLAQVWTRLVPLYGGPIRSELGVRPHLTLALFRDGEPRDVAGAVEALAATSEPFALDLSTVDHFATDEGVVFLRPGPSPELARANAALHARLEGDRNLVHAYYRPGAWHPHCTMAIDVPAPALEAVLAACRTSGAPGRVRVVAVHTVRYRPATEVMSAQFGGHPAP